MVYEESGTPIQGLTGGQGCDKRHDVKLAGDKQSFKFFVEMACNEMFGVGREGLVNPPDPQRTFQLCKCDIAGKCPLIYTRKVPLTQEYGCCCSL